jgi:hypothetical protein
MKSFAVTVLLDAEDAHTTQVAVVRHLNESIDLHNIEINDIEEIPE